MSKQRRDEDAPKDLRSTADRLREMNHLVKWVLWKMATDVVNVHAQGRADAQELFSDPNWVANVVGEYVANDPHAPPFTPDWKTFLESLSDDTKL